jgi:hypothetical protein
MLADIFSEDFIGMIIGFFMVVIIPLVWMLLHHQRKMAELLHRNAVGQNSQAQIDRLETEVRELKDRMNHLILQTDDRQELRERVSPPNLPNLH